MEQHLSEYDIRLAKRQQLIDMGLTPYAQQWDKRDSVVTLVECGTLNAKELRSIEDILANPQTPYSTAGRIMLKRSSGKLMFGQLMDETGTIQIMREYQSSKLAKELKGGKAEKPTQGNSELFSVQRSAFIGDSTKPFDYLLADKLLDVGDIIGIRGELFFTHKGELTLFVSEFQLLSKALRPLGDKRHGIGEDNQERAYRQRYLDMIFNEETVKRMKLRSNFIRTLREFYWKHDFLEIDCPVLTPAASGAAAKPFVTYHNDFDREFYLRICNETELKKATVGGLEKVFTIATNFRNEGSDPSHLQEFMMLEHQAVFKSFHEDMDFTQKMFDYVFDTLQLNRKFEVKDKLGNPKEVDFTSPWPRIDYVEGVNKASGLDIASYTIDDADKLRADIKAKGIEFEGMDKMGTMTLIDYLYKKVLRPTITGPAFIYNYPSIIAPLARISDEDPRKCEKRQVVVNGREIINSYGELVDPVRQKENFDEQSKAEEGGDMEATSADLEFVKAMEYGMPIQAGFGMGIDRIIALISQQENLRDVVMFPLMKPENSGQSDSRDMGLPFPPKELITHNSLFAKEGGGVANGGIQGDVSSSVSNDFVTRAESLATKYLSSTLLHCQQVAHCMRYFAKKLGKSEGEQNYRYIVGLLHDVDRDMIDKDANRHIKDELVQILLELNLEESLHNQLLQDIRSHGPYLSGIHPTTQLQKYLISIDELSGLMYAYARMKGGSFEEMEVSGVMKRIKDLKFAAGVDRSHVRHCETELGISLEDFIGQMIEALS